MENKINLLYKEIKKILESNNHNIEIIYTGNEYVQDFIIDKEYLIRIYSSFDDKKLPMGAQYYNYLIDFCHINNFDRWANSGWTQGYDYEKDILTTFEDDSLWITLGLVDSLSDVIEDCKFKNDYSNLETVKKMLLEMLKEN